MVFCANLAVFGGLATFSRHFGGALIDLVHS